jgi:hypothetical protein
MDRLKQLVASKRKETEDEFAGKKFAKRAELEQARLQKLREEEEAERKVKVGILNFRIIQHFSLDNCRNKSFLIVVSDPSPRLLLFYYGD